MFSHPGEKCLPLLQVNTHLLSRVLGSLQACSCDYGHVNVLSFRCYVISEPTINIDQIEQMTAAAAAVFVVCGTFVRKVYLAQSKPLILLYLIRRPLQYNIVEYYITYSIYIRT